MNSSEDIKPKPLASLLMPRGSLTTKHIHDDLNFSFLKYLTQCICSDPPPLVSSASNHVNPLAVSLLDEIFN